MPEERTLVARFENSPAAQDALQRLVRAGVPERVLQLITPEEAGSEAPSPRTHSLLIARIPESAAADLAAALSELGASRVDDSSRPSAPAHDVNFRTFTESVFELPEFTEETIAVKRPWVIEEVVLGTAGRERTETVRETLLRRDVTVERPGSAG